MKKKYERILLKISGEALGGKSGASFDANVLHYVAREIKKVVAQNVKVGLVVGAGNIFRGKESAGFHIHPLQGDLIGMEATMINSLMIHEILRHYGIASIVLSALGENIIVNKYTIEKAKRHFEQGDVVICAGGTGSPFFTTDTCAMLRGMELQCDVVLKATKVDGVYTADPIKDKKAKKYDLLTYQEAIDKKLRIIDQAAFTLAEENSMPLVVFNLFEENALLGIVKGEKVGTLVR